MQAHSLPFAFCRQKSAQLSIGADTTANTNLVTPFGYRCGKSFLNKGGNYGRLVTCRDIRTMFVK